MSNKYLTSPPGEIQFMAIENPVTDSKTEKEQYSIKLAFDVEKDAEWLAQIEEINHAKVVTAKTYRGKSEAAKKVLAQGKAFVEAKSIYKPQGYDASGNELEENPMFFPESKGTARMIVQPYKGQNGGTINLMGVLIESIEGNESSGSVDRETRLAQLKAAVEAATKG
jgi:hypothetical protein